MEKLSQELIDQITSYFHPYFESDDMVQMLTVSKAFQNSVERIMLAQYFLTESKADQFLRQYSGQRALYLRYIHFLPTLPMAHVDRNRGEGCRETSNQLLEKDKHFTRQIGVLLRTLKSLEDRSGGNKMRGRLHLTVFPPKRAVSDVPCRHLVCVCWRVHLLHPEILPLLSSVHTLEFQDEGLFTNRGRGYSEPEAIDQHVPSKLDLRILLDLASRITSLETLQCRLKTYWHEMNSGHEPSRHYAQDWAGPHRDTRHDFARLSDSTTLPLLKRLNLQFLCHGEEHHRDQREILPNLVLPRPYDPFSTSLRVLSYHLEVMILRVIADHTLFWPGDGTTPYWPNLKYIDVYFSAFSPSGEWYFQGSQGEGSDTSPGYEITQAHYEPMEANATDSHYDGLWNLNRNPTKRQAQFRIVPINKTLGPFIVSFAKAANGMPRLQKALLWTRLELDCHYSHDMEPEIGSILDGESLGWGIAYAKPGENFEGFCSHSNKGHPNCGPPQFWKNVGQENCASRQFWWITGDWRPEEFVYSSVDKIGEAQHGNSAIRNWVDEWTDPDVFRHLVRWPIDRRPQPHPSHMDASSVINRVKQSNTETI